MKVNKSERAYWLDFYTVEREMFEYFQVPEEHDMKLLHKIPGYEPNYGITFSQRGKPVHFPPKNIKQIIYVPDSIRNTIKELTDVMEERYRLAVEAGGNEFEKMPIRHPRWIDDEITLCKYSQYPAHASSAVKAGEPVVLAKRYSNLFKGKSDEHIEHLWKHYINCFGQLGIDASVNEAMTHLEVSGDGILNYAKSSEVQLRISSGTQYKLRLHDTLGQVHCHPYGFMFLRNPCKVVKVEQKQISTRIEDIGRRLPFEFLDKTIKFWNKGPIQKTC